MQELGISPVVWVDAPECEAFARASFKSLDFAFRDWQSELEGTIGAADIVILDTYAPLDERFTRLAERSQARVAFIDDTVRRRYAAGTIVIDWTVGVEGAAKHPYSPGVIWLLGLRYAAFRREFWDIGRFAVRSDLRSIAISMGGSDVRNLTAGIVDTLHAALPDVTLEVVIGPGFSSAKSNLRNGPLITFHHNLDAAGMIRLLRSCDLCIASAGQTLYEVARVGIPSCSILVADNQREDVEGWDRIGSVRYCGAWDDKDLMAKIRSFAREMRNTSDRAEIAAIRAVDGQGARRIAERLVSA
jgi:UDP-2,4-diacetamido-2,4,6-trideoxy-beta-L-altropyranose hydrolase